MSDTLVTNELLAFLQQKLDVMDEVAAIQICSTSFSEEDVAAAKLLLYRSLNKSDQMVSRRRDGTKKSLQDIISLLKATDPDDVPTFVVKDLSKLPPVTFDHVDVTSLLKDIVFLKASLADVHKRLDASQNMVTLLRTELNEVRNNVVVTESPAHNINTRRGAGHCDTSITSFASAVLSSPRNAESAESAEPVAKLPHNTAPVPAISPQIVARPNPRVTTSTPVASVKKTMPDKTKTQVIDDGFVTVQKKHRRHKNSSNLCGTASVGSGVSLRAAEPNTPVYISRLHYTTKAEDIGEYVHQKIKYVPRVQLLESRRNVDFKAFVVRVPTCHLQLVMKEDFWPKGVVFRRFRGPVPHERTLT